MIAFHKLFLIQKLQGKGIKSFFENTIRKQQNGVQTDGGKGKKGNFLTSRKK